MTKKLPSEITVPVVVISNSSFPGKLRAEYSLLLRVKVVRDVAATKDVKSKLAASFFMSSCILLLSALRVPYNPVAVSSFGVVIPLTTIKRSLISVIVSFGARTIF